MSKNKNDFKILLERLIFFLPTEGVNPERAILSFLRDVEKKGKFSLLNDMLLDIMAILHDWRDMTGQRESALHFAAENNLPLLAEACIKHGICADVRDEFNHTPLHYAAQNNNVAVVKVLLKHDASPTAQNTSGETPLNIAVNPARRSTTRADETNLETESQKLIALAIKENEIRMQKLIYPGRQNANETEAKRAVPVGTPEEIKNTLKELKKKADDRRKKNLRNRARVDNNPRNIKLR